MKVYTYELTMEKEGQLTIENLPFDIGEKIEVIIIPQSKSLSTESRYPLWGKPITYINPTEPVADEDWEVL